MIERENDHALDCTTYFNMQDELDNYILEKRGMSQEPALIKKKRALKVEIHELENEVRAFKFWSSKPPSANEIILEEFVDGIHFLLSIGNSIRFPWVHYGIDEAATLNEQFDLLDSAASSVTCPIGWWHTLAAFRGLAKKLNFDWTNDIFPAYEKKYQENIARQQRGY